MQYEVHINLDDDTLSALSQGFQMQIFKAVKSANPSSNALPTVWYIFNEFSNAVNFSWNTKYGGYFSNIDVDDGNKIDISTKQPMKPGDLITLMEDGSSSVSTTGGVKGAFKFESKKENTWTSGMMVSPEGCPLSPICAFPQYGTSSNIFKPYEKILIFFTQRKLEVGDAVKQTSSKSISIIFPDSTATISVGFNINTGWDTKGNPNATANPMDFDLAKDLIIFSKKINNKLI